MIAPDQREGVVAESGSPLPHGQGAADAPSNSASQAAFGPNHTVIVTPTEKIGDKIGPYSLREQIGEGGFGVVYLAEQDEPAKRLVALKVIKLGMDTKEVIARFENERQALALMDHPGIAKVLGAGVTDAGRPYFVMELVKGVPITDFCNKHKLSIRERLELFILVCQAVQHAHQKAIIHRDIKPSNILVSSQNGTPVPMIIDFGLAKATAGQRLSDHTVVTALRQFMGTLDYASPEQIEMSARGVDTRTDIYALGVLLYELITGKTPFDPGGANARNEDELRRKILENEPPLPSHRLATMPEVELKHVAKQRGVESAKLIHQVRGDLDWILIKALEKDRARRYETANGLATDLMRHLTNKPVVARPPGNFYKLQKLVRRHRLLVTAAAAVFIALAAGLGVSSWLLRQEREAHRQTMAEAAKSRRVARFLVGVIKGVEPSVAMGRDTTLLREILERTVERIGPDLKNEPEVEAELRSTIGEVYLSLGEFTKAEAMQRQALAIRRKLFGNENLDVTHSLNNLADALREQKRFAEAENSYRTALKMQKKLLGNDHAEVASTLHRLAGLLELENRTPESEAALRECLAIRERLTPNDWQTFWTRSTLGGSLLTQKKYAEAEPLIVSGYNGLKEHLDQIPPPAKPRLKTALQHLLQIYQDTNRPDLAAKSKMELAALDQPENEKVGR